MTQYLPRMVAGSGDERGHEAGGRLVLGVLTDQDARYGRKVGLGGVYLPAQCRLPATLARHDLVLGQPVGVSLGALFLGGIPLAEQEKRTGQVDDRDGQAVPGAGLADAADRLPAGFRACCRVGDPQVKGQVTQRSSPRKVVSDLAGDPGALSVVGDRLDVAAEAGEIDPAGVEQPAQQTQGRRRGPGRGPAPRR